jgi:ABC-type polysaccharide/polyol phosphate export permease
MGAIKKGIGESVRFLPLLRELIKRDFKMKYKRTYLGILWTLLDPLLHMLVIIIVFSQLLGRDIQFFAAYVMTGRLMVSFFTQTTGFCIGSFVGGGMYIKSVKMPLYMLPLSKTISALINFGIALIVLAPILYFSGVQLRLMMLLFPLPILYAFVFSYGFGLALGTWMVYFRDVSHLHGVLATLLFFLTPIFYPIEIIPQNFLWVIQSNPLYHFVTMMRNLIMYGSIPSLTDHLICTAFCVGAMILGISVFRKGKNAFILHI